MSDELREMIECKVEGLLAAYGNKRSAEEDKRNPLRFKEPYVGFNDMMIEMMDSFFEEAREQFILDIFNLVRDQYR